MAKLDELSKDLPYLKHYLEDKDRSSEIFSKMEQQKTAHLINEDWAKERAPQSDKERQQKLEQKFEYATPESQENVLTTSQVPASKQSIESETYVQKMKEQIDEKSQTQQLSTLQETYPHSIQEYARLHLSPQQIDIYFKYARPESEQNLTEGGKKVSQQIDENVRREWPSVTQQRGPFSETIDQQRVTKLPTDAPVMPSEEGLVPLKMQEGIRPTELMQQVPAPQPAPKPLPTMGTERESLVESEMRWEKERGLLPDQPEETSQYTTMRGAIPEQVSRAPNPDITAESERYVAQHPSQDDYETEKSFYTLQSQPQPGQEPQAPSDEQGLIEHLQTPLPDRDQPTTVHPSREARALTPPPPQPAHLKLRDYPTAEQQQMARKEERIRPKADDKSLQTEFKSDVGEITTKLIEKQSKEEKPTVPEVERAEDASRISHEMQEKLRIEQQPNKGVEQERLEPENETQYPTETLHSTTARASQSEKEARVDLERLDVHDLIDYLKKHKNIIDEMLGEEDKKRIDVVLNVAKDIRTLCQEAVDNLKNDLQEFYNISKTKWQQAVSEMDKLGPEEEKKSTKHQRQYS